MTRVEVFNRLFRYSVMLQIADHELSHLGKKMDPDTAKMFVKASLSVVSDALELMVEEDHIEKWELDARAQSIIEEIETSELLTRKSK